MTKSHVISRSMKLQADEMAGQGMMQNRNESELCA